MTQKAIITDLNRCTGCLSCTVACKLINDVPVGNFWVRTLRVGPVPKAGGTGDFPDVDMYYLPVQCQHCANPECVEVCPTGASAKLDDGTVHRLPAVHQRLPLRRALPQRGSQRSAEVHHVPRHR